MAQATVAAGAIQFGWIQIKGLATLARALGGGPTVGQAVTTAGGAIGAVNVTAAFTNYAIGTAYDTANRKILCDFPY